MSKTTVPEVAALDADYAGSYPRTTQPLAEWHARAPQVAALEPDLPIVDPHHHLFGTGDDAVHYRLEDLQRDLSGGHRVLGTVYVEAYCAGWRPSGPGHLRPVGEVERIVGLTRSSLPTPHGPCQVAAGIVAQADMCLGEATEEVLLQHLAAGEGRLRGARQHAATDDGTVGRFIKHKPRAQLMADAAFRRGVVRVGQLGLGFDAWVYHTQLEELQALADAAPDTPIVLNHVGGVMGIAEHRLQRAELLARWRQALHELARRPNVSVKLGGMGMPVFGFRFEHGQQPPSSVELASAWQPYIDTCLEALGSARCMFESNFPVDKQSCSYTELWNAFKLATVALSPDERSDLFHRTACRTYRLTELAAAIAR